MSQLSALRSRAAELGIAFDQRWGENKLAGIIAAKEEELGITPEVAQPEPEPVAEPEKVVEQVQEQPEPVQLEAADTGATNEPVVEVVTQQEPTQAESVAGLDFDAESMKVKNVSPNPVTICFMYKAKPGFTVTLTGNQLTDKLRKKIAYGVKLGLLELV
jgi:hypothetical protein